MKKKNILKGMAIFGIIIVIIAGAYIYMHYFKKIKTSEFDRKINVYGLNSMYNNKSNNPNENVTKLEAIKLVIASTNNTIDLSTLILGNSIGDDAKVLEYAYKNGIVYENEVDLNNCNKNAQIIDLVKYISRAKYYILKEDYKKTDNILLKDYRKYNENEKTYIVDLLASEVIENEKKNLKGYSTLKKSVSNRFIVNYIDKFSLLASNSKILTDTEKFPSNSNDYPYIVEGVEKEVYEQNYTIDSEKNFLTPADFYSYRKEYYTSTIERAESYYNNILNISYETVSYDDMKNKIKDLVVGELDEDKLKEYIEYIKKNQIIIEGSAKVQEPCIYNDGGSCRVRMKLHFNVLNSLTRENLLFMDLTSDKVKEYSKDNYDIYIDAPMGYVMGSKEVYVSPNEIVSMLLDISKNEIVVK